MPRPSVDLTGQRFGRWVALYRLEDKKWWCRCDCGTEKGVNGITLRRGESKSCGCLSRPPRRNLAGKVVGRLTVIEWTPEKHGRARCAYWKCKCECGNIAFVSSNKLVAGTTRSCGCLAKEKNIRHGLADTRVHRIWMGMRKRCLNENGSVYDRYGTLGFCKGFEVFEDFLDVMGQPPDGTSIDRIDNESGYHCGNCEECRESGWNLNCRWATDRQQCRNSRRNVATILSDGRRATAIELSEETGIPARIIRKRIKQGLTDKTGLLDVYTGSRK